MTLVGDGSAEKISVESIHLLRNMIGIHHIPSTLLLGFYESAIETSKSCCPRLMLMVAHHRGKTSWSLLPAIDFRETCSLLVLHGMAPSRATRHVQLGDMLNYYKSGRAFPPNFILRLAFIM